MLQVTGLNQTFSGKRILHDVSFEVPDSSIVGFIGRNGAGKTTTIKSIVGIYPIPSGVVVLDGADMKRNPIAVKEKIAYVPDTPNLYDTMSCLSYLQFMASIYKCDPVQAQQDIEHLATDLQIIDELNEPISALSHGMQQKIALMGALVHKPKLLVLDEPFVGLDPVITHILKEKMKEICSGGSSILFSSHTLDAVQNLCDQLVVIKDGHIIQTGKTHDIVAEGSLEDYFLSVELGEKAPSHTDAPVGFEQLQTKDNARSDVQSSQSTAPSCEGGEHSWTGRD